MKTFKKIFAFALSLVMVLSVAPCAFAAEDIDYEIGNPYEKVDFSAWNQYKFDPHCHTTFSDGGNTMAEMVERHYELDFDIIALTDHGTVSYGFTNQPQTRVMKIFSLVKNGFVTDETLSANGTAANGNAYKVTEANGDEYYSQTLASGTDGQQMLRVPFGNEQNPTSFNNAHVNTWFADYGHGVVGGTSNYLSPISAVDELGGLSVINHPGEYTNARDELLTEDAYNIEESIYNYKVNKFANLLTTYKTCLGIDINSKGDSRTRFDRKLWDILLQKIVPTGRNVFAIASSDAHNLDIVDSGYTSVLMPELTSAALKSSMENGSFFAASKYIGNYDELVQLEKELKASTDPAAAKFLNETLSPLIDTIYNEIFVEGDQGTRFKAADGTTVPSITNITVNETEDTIAVETANALTVHWIANGKVIHVGNRIDLDDYSDDITSYVRAEAYGEGGVVYSQPFTLDYDGAPTAEKENFFDWGTIASAICDTPVKILALILPIELIVSLFK